MNQFFQNGTFFTGCNYWASHAGTSMWHDWSEETVSKDLGLCASRGMKVLRVFPLWPDFQPVRRMYGCGGEKMELRFHEEPLSGTEEGAAGIDPVMMERFECLCKIAQKNGLSLVVGLITGWMSGRLFVPPALEGVDILTDPEAIRLQVKFIRCFVKRMKKYKSVLAWDLGNECNCLQSNDKISPSSAWLWIHSIVSAIKMEDKTRPVVSGMHGLQMNEKHSWSIQANAELLDVLTTHPYPLFTPFCNVSAFNELPTTLHSTAESLLYADIGGKQCFVEEAGSLGPMQCSDKRAAANMRSSLFSAWAHDLRGYLWWCGFDQTHLKHPPYDWIGMERELGLFTVDHQPKQTVGAMQEFTEYLKSLPFEKLPPRKTDAVCILTHDQEHWKIAFSSFYLAKQAGFELKFASASASLPDSGFYMMPSIAGFRVIDKHRYDALLKKVENGASLFVTCGDGVLQPFGDVFGCGIDFRTKKSSLTCFQLKGEKSELKCDSPVTQKLIVGKGTVLAKDDEGNPVLVQSSYGKGKVFFLSVPIENSALENKNGFWKIYRKIFEISGGKIHFPAKPSSVGITEHFDGKNTVCVMINYSSEPVKFNLGRPVLKCFPGICKNGMISIPGNDGATVIFSGSLSTEKTIRKT